MNKEINSTNKDRCLNKRTFMKPTKAMTVGFSDEQVQALELVYSVNQLCSLGGKYVAIASNELLV